MLLPFIAIKMRRSFSLCTTGDFACWESATEAAKQESALANVEIPLSTRNDENFKAAT